MRLPWSRRDGDADGAPPRAAAPSPDPTGRLADRLHREVEDLRAGLTDDLLLTLLLLGEDEVDEAVGLLDLGSDRLHRFQDRVGDAVADAAVEREAELVLAAAVDVPLDDGLPRTRGTARRIRALASVTAAILTAVVALVSIEPAEDPELVAAGASSQPAASAPAAPGLTPVSSSDDGADAARTASAGSAAAGTPSERFEVLRAIADQGGVLARLGNEPRRSVVAALFGADHLIGEVADDIGDALPGDPVDAVTETAAELEARLDDPSPEPEPQTDGSPSEEPAADTDPATEGPSEEPEEDGSSEPEGTADDEPSEEPTDDGSDETDGSFPWSPGSGLL